MPSELPVEIALQRATGPRRPEADELLNLLQTVTGVQAVVWGDRIIGFGEHEYQYDSGRQGRAPELAFATGSRHTIYLVEDFAERWPDTLRRMGHHRVSKSCLYLTSLARTDRAALRELLEVSLADIRRGRTEKVAR